jgi:hypothetical protein
MRLQGTARSLRWRCWWAALALASITVQTSATQETHVVHLEDGDNGAHYSSRELQAEVCQLSCDEPTKLLSEGSRHSEDILEGLKELCGQAGPNRLMSFPECQKKVEHFCQVRR